MPSLLSQGVKLNSEPTNQTNRCGSEWKTHGNCCDEASLIKHLTEEDKELKESSQSLLTEMEQVIKALWKTLFGMEKQKDNSEGKKKFGQIIKKAVSVVGDFFKSLFKNIGDLAKLNRDFNREKEDIEKYQKGCLNKVQQLRASSLCSVCSARSQVFFHGGKAVMDMPTCRSVITECHEYWKSLVNLINTASSASESIDEARKILRVPPKTTAIRYLKKWIDEKNLEHGLENCKSVKDCSNKDAGFICESLIRIQDLSSIEKQTTEVLGQQTKSFQKLAQIVDPLNLNKKWSESNFRRRLSWDPKSDAAFTSFSDVCVVIDLQFTSGSLPMDFSLLMP